ncbi:ubiquitin-associated protein 2a isoform X3 [Pseudoliparis swirei]|uniref:ubiquitin-associated protein 2a isoform X3 n=1 Tax=Pseudoliparis swirei TaxID=2059687 RepID=UPI0024BDE77C|nr:ubiquitin-associated protein 2a isoform X3 [Pseudoliparis swirei]
MMSSLGGDKARGPREKAVPAATHASQPQKQIQVTAEQIRLAQVIYDKNDAAFEDKVNQLMEVTGKNQDDCMVALHDCSEDVSRAINFLLESTSDKTSWEMVGRKKPLVKDPSDQENQEKREKKGEREAGKGRAAAGRRGQGGGRSRPARPEENGVEAPPPLDGGPDRGRRARGGGRGSRARGWGPPGARFSAQGMGTFNPADYASEGGSGATQSQVWDPAAPGSTEGSGAWRGTLEDWASEDCEDLSLSETKVFTSSCAAENQVTPGHSLDLGALLQKPVAGGREPPSSSSSSSQSLVFTNSHHHQPAGRSSSSSYAHAALSSVLGSGFGDLGPAKRAPPSAGSQILEQLKGPGLGPLPSSQAPPTSTQGSSASMCCLPGLGAPPPPSSSWGVKASDPSAASQFSREFGLQPEPSLVLSQLDQRPAGPASPLARQASPPSHLQAAPPSPAHRTHGAAKPAAPGAGPDPQGATLQRAQLRGQRRRVPPSSKIPSTAVEMPGSADVPGLDLQFGALDFGSESPLPEFGVVDNCATTSTPGPQNQTSLYSKPLSESLGGPLSAAPPLCSSGLAVSSGAAPCSSTASGSSSSHFSSVGGGYDGTAAPHARLAFPQSQEAPGPVMQNGLNGVRAPAALDASSASSPPKPESPSLNISTNGASGSSHLASSLPPHGSTALSSQDTPPSTGQLTALSSHVSNHSSVSALGSGSLTMEQLRWAVLMRPSCPQYTSGSLAPSTGSYASAQHLALQSHNSSISHMGNVGNHPSGPLGGVGGAGVLHSAANTAPGLGSNGGAGPSAARTAALLSAGTGKAPPNLSQGVPPLLPNQYIMGPGGLLPAYPIYGYEDLHMLQSRLPMPSLQDYYGITFPAPTATLSGRDGGLANNPYSEVTKFGRNDATSPAPPTSLAAPQASQGQVQNQNPAPQNQAQQAFLPPGYSYTGLPYYAGVPGAAAAAAFQYGHAMFVPPGGPGPASAKQHGMGLGLGGPLGGPFQQQPGGYGQHAFSAGYEELSAGPAGGDYIGYAAAAQAKAGAAGPKGRPEPPGPETGVSVNSEVPDISGSVYNKTQSFDKQGFHAATPPPFSLPSALGGPGPLNPGGATGGYAPAPFLHILPHQQQQQLLHHHHHHHLAQEGQGPSQRGPSSSLQQKSQVNKSSYGSPYWAN